MGTGILDMLCLRGGHFSILPLKKKMLPDRFPFLNFNMIRYFSYSNLVVYFSWLCAIENSFL